jgi:hypothetical protein
MYKYKYKYKNKNEKQKQKKEESMIMMHDATGLVASSSCAYDARCVFCFLVLLCIIFPNILSAL